MDATVQQWAAWSNIVAAVALVATAIIMARSSSAAERSADASEAAIHGQLLAGLLDEYGSREYLDAAKQLRQWVGPEGGSGGYPSESLDAARRTVSSYFRKVYHLHDRGFLDEDDLTECVAQPYMVELLLEKAELVEREKRADYNRQIFDFFDNFYLERGVELNRPLRSYSGPEDSDA